MSTATYSPAVTRALAHIDAAKKTVDPAVADCLDFIGDLITRSGDPDAVFDRVLQLIARERGEAAQ